MDFAGNSETSTKASARELTRTFSKLNSTQRNVQSARSTGKRMFIFNKESNYEDKDEEEFQEIIITNEIKQITDLIDLSNKHIIKPNVKYSIDLPKLKNIIPHLQELNNMIGMEDIKKSLSYQLMYFLQGFEFKHMLHTIIEGPPGVGKTCLGKLLG
jgi:ABC-type uncharacterized transport system fused permease/ATPase subunit